jgi:hypothetical protein|tara:strand:- start:288 stop:998 length:711 start_codon:yes stop_codon:yes gene_type:complete
MEIEYTGEPHKNRLIKKHHLVIIVIAIFLIILSFVIYTSFYNPSVTGSIITGNIVGGSENQGVKFNAKLTIPSLNINGKFEKLEITGSSDSVLYVGNQKFDLGNSNDNYLILKNYDGEISFNENEILKLKGKASTVTVNGVIVTSQTKNTTKISFGKSFNYESLEISKKVLINKLAYKTSGIIMLDEEKNIFNINDEEIVITNFNGDLTIENGKSQFKGYLKKLEIKGDSEISVFS